MEQTAAAQAKEVSPYKLEWEWGLFGSTDTITITSTVDSLTIFKVTANRGNCETPMVISGLIALENEIWILKSKTIYDPLNADIQTRLKVLEQDLQQAKNEGDKKNQLPQTLKFGQSLKFKTKECKILELVWETDHGTWRSSFY
jgi:hypothetical protein